MPRERLITHHRRKVLRKRITLAETLFGASFIVLVALATVWIAAQGDNFDPADRDISFDLLQEQSVDDVLYVPPLKRWVDPGAAREEAGLPDLAPFPAEILADAWELDGRVESYDESNVYEKIDGAAEQYRAFGFLALHYVTLVRGADFLNYEIYDQGEFRNALGIFSAQRAAGREVSTRGEVYYYETPVGVIGAYRNLYFKVAGSGESPGILDKARSFLDLVESIPAEPEPPPPAFTILTRDLEVPFDGLEYQREQVFQYEFLSDFWFGTVPSDRSARYFIHDASDSSAAGSLFRRIEREQENEYTLVEADGTRALMQHAFLKTWFGLRASGGYVYGVDGAASREAAAAALATLDEVLGREG